MPILRRLGVGGGVIYGNVYCYARAGRIKVGKCLLLYVFFGNLPILLQDQAMLRKPVFISGLRKSGTSMVKNLLDNHPQLFVYPPNEFHFFKFTHFHNLGRTVRPASSRQRPIREIAETICNDKWFNPFQRQTNIDWDAFVDIEQLHRLIRSTRATSYRELFVDIANAMAAATITFDGDLEIRRFTCKGVQQEEFFPELKQWFPDLKMIYVLRNPYAQLNSAINNMRHGRKGLDAKLHVGTDLKKLDASFAYPYLGPRLRQMRVSYYFMRKFAELSPDSFYILKYDELLRDPDAELQRLCGFLELEYHETLKELTLCGQPMKRMGWSVKKYQDNRITAAPLNAWQKQLAGQAVRLINRYFEDILQDYRYTIEQSRAPLWKKFDPSEDLKKYLANRLLFTKPVRKLL